MGVHLLTRALPAGGTSSVDLYERDGDLVLLEHDLGPTVERTYGPGAEVEYYLTVPAEALPRLLELLGLARSIPIQESDLDAVGAVLVARFGSDLGMVRAYRTWLGTSEVPFTAHVR